MLEDIYRQDVRRGTGVLPKLGVSDLKCTMPTQAVAGGCPLETGDQYLLR